MPLLDKTVLERGEKEGETIDDAARKNWGDKWRMPTSGDFDELALNTNNRWAYNYNGTDKAGYVFTSKTDGTKSIFLPAAGYRLSSSLSYDGSIGYYWSSVALSGKRSRDAYCISIADIVIGKGIGEARFVGFPIRPVAP